jgi:hypothetical protein
VAHQRTDSPAAEGACRHCTLRDQTAFTAVNPVPRSPLTTDQSKGPHKHCVATDAPVRWTGFSPKGSISFYMTYRDTLSHRGLMSATHDTVVSRWSGVLARHAALRRNLGWKQRQEIEWQRVPQSAALPFCLLPHRWLTSRLLLKLHSTPTRTTTTLINPTPCLHQSHMYPANPPCQAWLRPVTQRAPIEIEPDERMSKHGWGTCLGGISETTQIGRPLLQGEKGVFWGGARLGAQPRGGLFSRP